MRLESFVNGTTGHLVDISGTDPRTGPWTHKAFVPVPLAQSMPELSGRALLAIGNARAGLGALDSTGSRLPNPTLLRIPTLRKEAQSTSALEGTYAPLVDVLAADTEGPVSAELREVLNYEFMAHIGFEAASEGRPLTVPTLSELQGILMRGTPLESESGRLRTSQVVVGLRSDAPDRADAITRSRFVPAPPGQLLESGLADLVQWMRVDHSEAIDPVVAAAMSHYQFETLHPFRDGNGRLGRFLIVHHLLTSGVLSEPTLTVSPWFEARRQEYYDVLFGVSARGDWESYVTFFARGLEAAARQTRDQMIDLVQAQDELKEIVRASSLRSETPMAVIDIAVAHPTFVVRDIEQMLGVSYGRANKVASQLVDIGVLAHLGESGYRRRLYAPRIHEVLLGGA